MVGRPPTPDGVERLAHAFSDMQPELQIEAYAPGARSLHRIALAQGVDVLLPVFRSPGPGFPLPWVGYLYDFQHEHLRRNFGPLERLRRRHAFRRMLRDAPVVLVNARAVRDDVARFFPGLERKVVALPFASVLQAEWLESDSKSMAAKFGMNRPYFVISNQFWVHKDHATAIRALQLVRTDPAGADVELVCTGAQHDFRAPGHFESIRTLIRELGLESAVRLLGVLPKREQIAVVREALAVVQPSLFEGGPGGGAGYDAVAVGTPLIASDIPVNRELHLGDVRLFRAGDPRDLAERMKLALQPTIRPTKEQLMERCNESLQALGACLMNAATIAIQTNPRLR
jgi:glycosyltransferase involved in cell wall biosynthesis